LEKAKWIDPCRICKNEVCSLVDHFVQTKRAKSILDAIKILSEQIDGEIPVETIRTIYYRKKTADRIKMSLPIVSNETPQSTPEDNSEIQEIQDEPTHGGEREGAGRPTKFPGSEERNAVPRRTESDELFGLKRLWKRTTKTDRQKFLTWIKREEET
jgi:hypothetical protein